MKLLKNITLTIMILLYIVAGLGYGLHTCSSDGTVTPIIMVQDASCESIHGHSHSHSDCCDQECSTDSLEHSSNEENNCCETDVYKIKEVYEASLPLQIEQLFEYIVALNPFSESDLSISLYTAYLNLKIPDDSPPEALPDDYHSLISVWRL